DFASLTRYLVNMLKKGNVGEVSAHPLSVQLTNAPHSAYVVDMYQDASRKLLLKRVFVDANSNLPIEWHDFTDGKLFAVTKWDNIKTNLNLSDDFFQV